MKNIKDSLIQIHLAVLLLGGTALFAKLVAQPAFITTFFRGFIAAITLGLILKITRKPLFVSNKKDAAMAFLLGLIMTLHWVTYFGAMQYAGVSVGIVAMFTFPVMTVFLEPLFEKSRPHWQDVVSAFAVTLGIFLMVPEFNLANSTTYGIAMGVTSALMYSMRNILLRKYFTHYSGVQSMWFQCVIITITLSFFMPYEELTLSTKDIGLLILLGSIFTAVPHAMVAASFKFLKAKSFSLITCLQPLYATILAMWILDEYPNAMTLLGGGLIVSAAVFETIATSKTSKD